MKCPKCSHETSIVNTIYKKDFTIRFRKCSNCHNSFKTIEQIATGWDYKNIVHEIKELVREVKC